jgi:hypothetical protein
LAGARAWAVRLSLRCAKPCGGGAGTTTRGRGVRSCGSGNGASTCWSDRPVGLRRGRAEAARAAPQAVAFGGANPPAPTHKAMSRFQRSSAVNTNYRARQGGLESGCRLGVGEPEGGAALRRPDAGRRHQSALLRQDLCPARRGLAGDPAPHCAEALAHGEAGRHDRRGRGLLEVRAAAAGAPRPRLPDVVRRRQRSRRGQQQGTRDRRPLRRARNREGGYGCRSGGSRRSMLV